MSVLVLLSGSTRFWIGLLHLPDGNHVARLRLAGYVHVPCQVGPKWLMRAI
jgi:hypothetical protein